MSKTNFKHIGQFTRGVHQPLPKSEQTSSTYWVKNDPFYIDPAKTQVGTKVDPETGVWKFVYTDRDTGKSMSVQELLKQSYDALLAKYPKPPSGPSRFLLKYTIPRGVSDVQPFGDPGIRFRGIPVFYGMPIHRQDITFIENWLDSFVRT